MLRGVYVVRGTGSKGRVRLGKFGGGRLVRRLSVLCLKA